MVPALLLMTVLGQAVAYPPPLPQAEATEPNWVTVFRGALEGSAQSFPSGTPGGGQDLFAVVTPIMSVDTGEDFGFELGAPLRLRLLDGAPEQRDLDYGGVLRREDWDERSDFGQLLRSVRIGSGESPVFFRAGAMPLVTIGHGHLVNRYSNQTNPDYHPAGAILTANLGPTHTEVFASDVLAARLFAAELSLDIGATFFASHAELADRFHVALSAAQDFGRSLLRTAPITLAAVDADAGFLRLPGVRADGYLNLSGRVDNGVSALGAAVGVRAQGAPGGVAIVGKLEARKQGGGLDQGLFGPDYELARFSSVGLDHPGAAEAVLPDSGSGYAELQLGAGPVEADDSGQGRVSLSAASEVFFWGRVDGDLALAFRTPGNKGVAVVRATLTGGNQAPRLNASGEFRYRLLASLYALATGGTVYFPQPDGTLVRGVYGGLGVGLDFER